MVPGHVLACRWVDGIHRFWGCGFSWVCVCSLKGEGGPKARVGSLMGGTRSWGWCLLTGVGSLAAGPWGSRVWCLGTGVWGWVLGPVVDEAVFGVAVGSGMS